MPLVMLFRSVSFVLAERWNDRQEKAMKYTLSAVPLRF